MKKYIITAFLGSVFLIGCAGKTTPIDKCALDKKTCEAKCKVDYPDKGFKYKACIAKCGTVYVGCKTKEKVKEGYYKTKEYFNKKD
jgi:hypothetical protein